MIDKNVFITGGAQGIGRAIVNAFIAEGAQVAFCDSNKTEGEKLSEESGATFFLVDRQSQRRARGMHESATVHLGRH